MDTTRNYTVALLSVLCIGVLVMQTYDGTHSHRYAICGVILLAAAFRIVNETKMKVACVLCIIVLVVRGFLQ